MSNKIAKQNSVFHTFLDYPTGCRLPGIIIPQVVYQAQPLARSQKRPNIPFVVNGQLGVRLGDVVDSSRANIYGLADAQSTPELTSNASLRITLRISWPGYEAWDKAIHTADHRVQLFTLGRLAHAVATAVRDFMSHNESARSTEADWWVSKVNFESLYLLELRHVSIGSWQPVLCVKMD